MFRTVYMSWEHRSRGKKSFGLFHFTLVENVSCSYFNKASTVHYMLQRWGDEAIHHRQLDVCSIAGQSSKLFKWCSSGWNSWWWGSYWSLCSPVHCEAVLFLRLCCEPWIIQWLWDVPFASKRLFTEDSCWGSLSMSTLTLAETHHLSLYELWCLSPTELRVDRSFGSFSACSLLNWASVWNVKDTSKEPIMSHWLGS